MADETRDKERLGPDMERAKRFGANPSLPNGDPIPEADVIYVNAGCTHPSDGWFRLLAPGGRLLFPLQPAYGIGAMLLIRRPLNPSSLWSARCVTRSIFIGCEGLQDQDAERRLAVSFATGNWIRVQALRFDAVDPPNCWSTGDGWRLSTASPR